MEPRDLWHHSITSSSVMVSPGLGTTNTLITSPRFSSGTPTAPASSTLGWVYSTSSSREDIH